MTCRTQFDVAVGDNEVLGGTIEVKVTDEGVIVDLAVDGEVVATWGATAQELADDYCH